MCDSVLQYIAHVMLLKCENVCNIDIACPNIGQWWKYIQVFHYLILQKIWQAEIVYAMWCLLKKEVESLGIDPSTSCMLSRRSTIWANSPLW